jgi:hypothetical protein
VLFISSGEKFTKGEIYQGQYRAGQRRQASRQRQFPVTGEVNEQASASPRVPNFPIAITI